MRFMGLLAAETQSAAALPSSKELLESMGKFMEQATHANMLMLPGGLRSSPLGARVKMMGGQVTVTGSVCNEPKGPTTPCAMFDVDSLAEAIQWTACLLQVLGGGECEIRPVC
jgi:hypothetical protein